MPQHRLPIDCSTNYPISPIISCLTVAPLHHGLSTGHQTSAPLGRPAPQQCILSPRLSTGGWRHPLPARWRAAAQARPGHAWTTGSPAHHHRPLLSGLTGMSNFAGTSELCAWTTTSPAHHDRYQEEGNRHRVCRSQHQHRYSNPIIPAPAHCLKPSHAPAQAIPRQLPSQAGKQTRQALGWGGFPLACTRQRRCGFWTVVASLTEHVCT